MRHAKKCQTYIGIWSFPALATGKGLESVQGLKKQPYRQCFWGKIVERKEIVLLGYEVVLGEKRRILEILPNKIG